MMVFCSDFSWFMLSMESAGFAVAIDKGAAANEAVHTVFERFYENLVVSRQSGIAVNLKC